MTKFLHSLTTWVFDLDNTLYSDKINVFKQVENNMRYFIMGRFNLDAQSAHDLQKKYFKHYGTTLNGLMAEHGVDPHDFMSYVHDIDLTALPAAPELGENLKRLSGKRYIFTNGSTAHAENILSHLGILDLFDGIFDIVDANFIPKPALETYQKFLDKFDIIPTEAIMFEDMAKNLTPALKLGMQGVWIKTDSAWGLPSETDLRPHYECDDLNEFLKSMLPES